MATAWGPWIMKQTWNDLLFAHWPIPFAQLRPLVPEGLMLDTFDGQCWIGVVPFWMSGVRARGLPAMPGFSRLPELNVRTYVTYGGKPGVYFFSLDITSHLAVWGARTVYHLPYFHAAMRLPGRRRSNSLFLDARPGGHTLASLAGRTRASAPTRAGRIRWQLWSYRPSSHPRQRIARGFSYCAVLSRTRSTKTRFTGATFIICLGLCRTPKRASSGTRWQRRPRLLARFGAASSFLERLSKS